MNLEHEFTVPVPIDEAWRVLLDVERVAPCMPGATLLSVDGRDFTGSVKVKVGPITVTYNGKATFAEVDDAAHRAVIEASGKETRGAGTAAATVTTQLEGRGATTQVRVTTDLNVTGRPAQFGRGVMAEVGGKLVQQFATCLADELSGGGASRDLSEPTAVMTAPGSDNSGPHGDPVAEAALAAPAPAKKTAAKKTVANKAAAKETAAKETPPPAKKAAPAKKVAAKKAAPTAQTVAAEPPAGAQPRAPAPVSPITPPRRPPAEPIDLFDVAGPSVAKRVAPVIAAVVLLLLLLRRRRRRAH
jgi:carbon monoxide dehydrogenase subunit G